MMELDIEDTICAAISLRVWRAIIIGLTIIRGCKSFFSKAFTSAVRIIRRHGHQAHTQLTGVICNSHHRIGWKGPRKELPNEVRAEDRPHLGELGKPEAIEGFDGCLKRDDLKRRRH
jgi:hypothetical protein